MWSQQIFVALLSACLALQHVAAVVNTGQTKAVEESEKPSATETKENEKKPDATDLVAESSETTNRREAPAISDTYGIPSLGSNLPVPVYGVPNAPSNNFVYPAPPPDIPPPPPSLYGPPTLGNTYGVPQVNPLPGKGYGPPHPVKYGAPPFTFNQFSNFIPPKPLYGPPKNSYGVPNKPPKFHKFPPKNFGLRPPKPIYGPPIYKDNFNFNKFNFKGNLNSNNFNNLYTSSLLNTFSTNSLSNLYSGVSSLNHQYGAPVLPPKPTLSLSVQYGVPNTGLSSQYGVPEKVFPESTAGYGPPQPSANPKPPHPGAPAPPTPPDIKYDGWQPIPGLVSKRPEEIHHVTGDGSGYHDLSPPPLSGNGHVSTSYGAPPVTLDLSQGPSVLEQPGGLSNSYGVPLNSGSKGISDSYGAPLGTVTGSGGIVASSGDEAHNSGSSSHSSSSHSLNIDLSSIGLGQGADVQAIKSIEYNISPQGHDSGSTLQLSNTYGPPQASGSVSAGHSFNSFSSSSQSIKGGFASSSHADAIGLVPPSGVYGAPPTTQYGTPLYTSSYKGSKGSGKGFGNSYLPPAPPVPPINSYGVPSTHGAISFQNVAHGSSTAGLNLQQFHIDGANALPLTSYNVPLGTVDGSYSLPAAGGGDIVELDYSHPSVSIDLTEGKSSSAQLDCYNKQQLQVPSLSYGVPSADSYTSSLSSLTTNIANSHGQSSYSSSQPQISLQYGVSDLAHSSSIKSESKVNSAVESTEEAHGKDYGKSVAASFGPNSELVESQSIDLNNIPLQGNLGSYTLQIQSADGGTGQVSHTQVLNEGLLQSILQAIEQPGKQGQNAQYPIILQPSVERSNYSVNETLSNLDNSHEQASEIREVRVEAPKSNNIEEEKAEDKTDDEETLQLLDTSNIALYYKKDGDMKKVEINEKPEENSLDNESS
ncbi:uncharacterized protein LOC126748954 [Anthonomus grandis grandis]|uniref:uncharacterized protein LOC126748954 n=1 Tax=Anthonomus grandis grandis TaxID=2921223 RepID=UPI002166B385|nr:uncharacterized protein LOC126748954 [Anthonomus grandis grandis]